ncbi:MAG: hypothetical protein K8R87_02825, partial [Verrucomicrobia bacterium]|nr:hypothetical protein [Verrucomicrobiota bacterium]
MGRADIILAKPLAWLAVAAICGIATADATTALIPFWSWAVAAIIMGAWMFRGQHLRKIFLLTFCVFAFRHAVVCDVMESSELRLLLEKRDIPLDVTAEGRVIKPLRRDLPG